MNYLPSGSPSITRRRSLPPGRSRSSCCGNGTCAEVLLQLRPSPTRRHPSQHVAGSPPGAAGRLGAAVQERIGYQQALGALTSYSLVSVPEIRVSVPRLVKALCVRVWTRMLLSAGRGQASGWSRPPFRRYPSRSMPGQRALVCCRTPWPRPRRKGIRTCRDCPAAHSAGRYLSGRADYAQAKELLDELWLSANPVSGLTTSTQPEVLTTWPWSCITKETWNVPLPARARPWHPRSPAAPGPPRYRPQPHQSRRCPTSPNALQCCWSPPGPGLDVLRGQHEPGSPRDRSLP